MTPDDLQAQFELKLAIRERSSETHTAINQIRALREQVKEWEVRAADREDVQDGGAGRSLDQFAGDRSAS